MPQFDPALIEVMKKVLEDTMTQGALGAFNPGSEGIFCRVYFESGSPGANQLRRADRCSS